MNRLAIVLLVMVMVLSGCGAAVDLDTPKSAELTAQYDYYPDSAKLIRDDMDVTPEQADEIFVVLTSCGLNEKITTLTQLNDDYTVWSGLKSYIVQLSDGVVSSVTEGANVIYPVPETLLIDSEIIEEDVTSENGAVVGKRGFIKVLKAQLRQITPEQFRSFADSKISDSDYSWFTVVCDDGTGIVFPGGQIIIGDYGKLDNEGLVPSDKIIGYVELGEGGYAYKPASDTDN